MVRCSSLFGQVLLLGTNLSINSFLGSKLFTKAIIIINTHSMDTPHE
jgi:hypothetical protein